MRIGGSIRAYRWLSKSVSCALTSRNNQTESQIGEIWATYIENTVQQCERNIPNYYKLDSYITFCSLRFTSYYYSVSHAKAEYEASKTQ